MFERFKKKEEFRQDDFVSKKDFEKLSNLVDTHQSFLNNLYIFYDFEETEFLSKMRNLSYEMMKFFDNVCRKHNLEYWLDYGTLLGAVRHSGFIPWDDDLDVGMMREDYLKFVEVMPSEIENSDLENVDASFKIDKHDKVTKRWFQVNFRRPEFKGKFVGIDVFPYDYVKGSADNIEDDYYTTRAEFNKKRGEGASITEAVNYMYSIYSLNMKKDEFYIPGVENVRGKVNLYKFAVLESDKLHPIQRVKFGKYDLPVPYDSHDYLIKIYGKKFMQIPRNIRDHGRLNRYRKQPRIMEMLCESNEMLEKANKNFK